MIDLSILKNQRKSIVACFIAGMVLLAVVCMDIFAQNEKSKLQSRKSKLEKEIFETNSELEKTKKNKSANLNQIVLLNKKINKREELISAIEQEVGGIDQQINKLSDAIFLMSVNLKNLKDEYSRIVYSTYRNRGAYNKLMFIFSSQNFNQAYKRLKYLKQYTEYRKNQVKTINETRVQVAAKKLELENQKASKLNLKHTQERERNNLSAEKIQKNDKIRNLTSQEKKLLKKLRDNETALSKLQIAIEALVVAEIRKANEEKARKAATIADAEHKAKNETAKKTVNAKEDESFTEKPEPIASLGKAPKELKKPAEPSNNMSSTDEEIALSGSFANNKGRLPSPVDKGIVISSFGEHAHAEFQNIKIKNNGIDITSIPGSKARAIFEGEVSSIIFIANLNYVVIIRHGDYLSVYSNLKEVTVKKGDKVMTRETLGTVFTSPGESRSRLHFELWQGTVLLNPAGWINM